MEDRGEAWHSFNNDFLDIVLKVQAAKPQISICIKDCKIFTYQRESLKSYICKFSKCAKNERSKSLRSRKSAFSKIKWNCF